MYSYQVNGEFYAGEIVRSFATESEADQFSELFKKDLAVLVRVHPEKPELSILREEDNAGRLAYAAGTLA